MKKLYTKFFLTTSILSSIICSQASLASSEDVEYCIAKNGTVETMIAAVQTNAGMRTDFPKILHS